MYDFSPERDPTKPLNLNESPESPLIEMLPILGDSPNSREAYTKGTPKNGTRQTSAKGIIFALIAALMTVVAASLRKLVPDISTFELLFIRCPFQFFPIFLYYLLQKRPREIVDSFGGRLFWIGICSALSQWFYYIAILHISLSELTTIYCTGAIMNGILTAIFLREPYSRIEKIMGAVSIVGVIFVVRPPFIFGSSSSSKTPENVNPDEMSEFDARLIALLSTVLFSIWQVALRGNRAKHHPFLVTFHIQAVAFFVYGFYFFFTDDYRSLKPEEYVGVFLNAMSIFAVIFCNAKALEYEKPSVIGLIGYTQLIYSILIDIFGFGIVPSFMTFIGVALIAGSCVMLVLRKR